MPKKKKTPNKSDFIRSQPSEMPASQVVAKAKEAGMSITPGLVYAVRSAGKAKKAKGRPAGKSAAAAPAGKPFTAGGSASDFIRSQPASRTARQVADDAHKHGFKFKPAYVYTIRRAHAKRGANPRRGRPPAKGLGVVAKAHHAAIHAPPHPTSHAEANSIKEALRLLMMRMGLDAFTSVSAEIVRDWKSGK